MSANAFQTKGFTLAELLIALAILGVIATFTIPKILTAQGDASFNAAAKEASAAITEAYQHYKRANPTVPSTLSAADMTPYLNYVKVVTTSYTIDNHYQLNTMNCSVTGPCIQLHNGGMLMLRSDRSFGGTTPTHGMTFLFDPDGKVTDGTTNGPGKSIQFRMLYNGRLVTRDTGIGTVDSAGMWVACAAPPCDPPWFSWN